jgi:hypothetical protein
MRMTKVKALLPLFWPDFAEHEGGLFLASTLPQPRLSLDAYSDLTAAEAFHNHVHIPDEFDHDASLDGTNPEGAYWDNTHPDFLAACEIGRRMAVMWHAKLRLEHPNRRTRVYFTSDDNPVVRFHCVRPGESVWLDDAGWLLKIAAGRVVVFDSAAGPPRSSAHLTAS